MSKSEPTRILFICMGNICRSPSAEGVFRQVIREQGDEHLFEIDSAGTHDYHVGKAPDRRSQQAALRRGVDISGLRARQAIAEDFYRYDLLIAMDHENLANLRAIAPAGLEGKLRLLLDFATDVEESEVPDPYYGGPQGFEHVLDLIERGAYGLWQAVREERY